MELWLKDSNSFRSCHDHFLWSGIHILNCFAVKLVSNIPLDMELSKNVNLHRNN